MKKLLARALTTALIFISISIPTFANDITLTFNGETLNTNVASTKESAPQSTPQVTQPKPVEIEKTFSPEVTNVHDKMKQQVSVSMKGRYSHELLYMDRYENILFVDWFKERNCYLYQTYKEPIKQYIGASREGYEDSKERFDMNTHNNYYKNIVLVPSVPTTTIEGHIDLPSEKLDNSDDLQIYIRLEKVIKDQLIQEGYIKVNENGKFKIDNLAEGDYKATPVMLNSSSSKPKEEFSLSTKAVNIKNGVEARLDYNNETYQKGNRIGLLDYFTLPEYQKPEQFLETSNYSELPNSIKKDIDQNINDKKDVSTIEEILKYVRKGYSKPKNNAVKNRMATAAQIIEQGEAIGCTNYATLFQAIVKYKGIPSIIVDATSTKHVEKLRKKDGEGVVGHVMVECYIDGKWILVNSTNGDVYLDYDTNNLRLESSSSPYKNDLLYIYYKAKDLSYLDVEHITEAQRMYDEVFDLSLREGAEKNKPTKNLLR